MPLHSHDPFPFPEQDEATEALVSILLSGLAIDRTSLGPDDTDVLNDALANVKNRMLPVTGALQVEIAQIALNTEFPEDVRASLLARFDESGEPDEMFAMLGERAAGIVEGFVRAHFMLGVHPLSLALEPALRVLHTFLEGIEDAEQLVEDALAVQRVRQRAG